MTATLRAVRPNERAETTEPAPSAVRRIVPRGRLAELTADHDRACEAAAAPDVVTAMRAGAPLEDSRPTRACPQCDGTTRHDGLCAVCRMDEHDAWREAQGGVQR